MFIKRFALPLVSLIVASSPAFASPHERIRRQSDSVTVHTTLRLQAASLAITNSSNATIVRIEVSPSASNEWGPDVLGSKVLGVGHKTTVEGITPGSWDIRVTDRAGLTKTWSNRVFEAGDRLTLTVDEWGWAGE